MSEEIDHLWALHGLDEQAMALRTELGRFPGERAAVEQRLAQERARLESVKAKMAEALKARRALEKEIDALGETERKYLSQQALVKTNAEYQALTHEIQQTKGKRSDLETGVLLKMEEEEQAAGAKPAAEAALKAAESEGAARVAKVDADERALREKLAAVDAERATHVEALSAGTRTRYERIHQMREGRAVVPIRDGSCGGCFRKQPPQALVDARRRERVLSCDGCGRLVVWPPDAA